MVELTRDVDRDSILLSTRSSQYSLYRMLLSAGVSCASSTVCFSVSLSFKGIFIAYLLNPRLKCSLVKTSSFYSLTGTEMYMAIINYNVLCVSIMCTFMHRQPCKEEELVITDV